MTEQLLETTIAAFNQRDFARAAEVSAQGLATAQGADEGFWLGLMEAGEGFALVAANKRVPAEKKLVGAMEKLRNFGFRYENFEVTSALAGVRQGLEEIRAVKDLHKKIFDLTLLPQLKLVAKADD